MSDLKQARTLLRAAGRDVSALRLIGETEEWADELLRFFVQQAAEKLFMSWVALLGENVPLIHDLEPLLDKLETREPGSARFRGLVGFTYYAVQGRYIDPDDHSQGQFDRGVLLKQAEALHLEVQRRFAGVKGSGQ